MPSHTVQSALVCMYHESDGAPWNFPTWKVITGVQHSLFSPDPSFLPKGWTAEDRKAVDIYFDQYKKQPSEEAKLAFSASRSNASQVPGREFFRKWVTRSWADWRIHARIEEILVAENIHPLIIIRTARKGTLDWPNGSVYIPLVVDAVGRALFGEESMDPLGLLSCDLREAVQALVQRTWINLWNQFKRNKKRLAELEKNTILAFESEYLTFPFV